MVKSTGATWEIINGACPELAGTSWNGKPEYCPVLSVVAEPDVVLPGVANRAEIEAEVERAKAAGVRP